MTIPFVIDNLTHRLADALNDLLDQSVGKPLRHRHGLLLDQRLQDGQGRASQVSGPSVSCWAPSRSSGADVGLKVDPSALKARHQGRPGSRAVHRGDAEARRGL